MGLGVDYLKIHNALDFYNKIGYKKIEVPWFVPLSVLDITAPHNVESIPIVDTNHCMVGSAEQSFLHMIIRNELSPGKYVACTPCYRDEPIIDAIHQKYFMKVELINTENPDNIGFGLTVLDALTYFQYYIPDAAIRNFSDGSADIVTPDGLELGSYGIRSHEKTGPWVYGTGCAEPRLSYAMWETGK
jgi:hypothetical protein